MRGAVPVAKFTRSLYLPAGYHYLAFDTPATGQWRPTGFWVSLLAKLGYEEQASVALTSLARAVKSSANEEGSWGFHEFLHGETGQPMGRRNQAWSAAAVILAHHAVHDGRFGCFEDGCRDS